MAKRTVDITVHVRVRIDPAGRKPTWWGRVWLAVSILAGRPVAIEWGPQ